MAKPTLTWAGAVKVENERTGRLAARAVEARGGRLTATAAVTETSWHR